MLDRAERIFAPGEIAATLAAAHVPAERIERLEFPMTEDRGRLEAAWNGAAERVGPPARDGDVAFVAVGDPRVYATFAHLSEALDADITVETVPGVSVLTAFTTALDVSIDGPELAIRDAREPLPSRLPDQVLLLKVLDVEGSHERLTDRGFAVRYGRRLFMDDSTVTDDPTALPETDYFTVAYAERASGSSPGRSDRGESLD